VVFVCAAASELLEPPVDAVGESKSFDEEIALVGLRHDPGDGAMRRVMPRGPWWLLAVLLQTQLTKCECRSLPVLLAPATPISAVT
jgi:hypothetical protein